MRTNALRSRGLAIRLAIGQTGPLTNVSVVLAIGLAICACMLVSGGRWGVLRTFKWDHAKSSSGDPIWRSDLERSGDARPPAFSWPSWMSWGMRTVRYSLGSRACLAALLCPARRGSQKPEQRQDSRNETPHQSPCSTQTHRRLTAPSLSCPFDPVDVPAVRTETRAAHTKIVSLVPIRY